MDPSRPNDQTLLDRLNALKPTSITLGKPTNAATVPTVEESQPASLEDALTARLKVLRNKTNQNNVNSIAGTPLSVRGHRSPDLPPADGLGTATQPLAHSPEDPPLPGRTSERKVVARASSPPECARPNASQKHGQPRFLGTGPDADDEDAALDELIEGLGDADFDLAADGDVEEPPADGDPLRVDAERVADLLRSLRADSTPGADRPASPEDDDDDSDGEQMARAVETVLSQLRDEMDSLPPPPPALGAKEPGEVAGADKTSILPGTNSSAADGDGDHPALALPAAPTQLVDPAPDAKAQEGRRNSSADLEADLSARLASLRGLGSPTATVDALGLPSAPTFRPQDRRPTSASAGKGLRSAKYTDEDQKTWCIACLDDATIRCIGCDGDVYCARCWREMHVGPSAGYDYRGHQWVKLERDNRA